MLPLLPGVGTFRSTVGRSLEMRVTPPAIAAFAEHDLLSVFDDFGHDFVGREIDDDGAQGHPHHARFAVATVAIRALPVFAALTFPMRLKFVIDEVVRVYVTEKNDVT